MDYRFMHLGIQRAFKSTKGANCICPWFSLYLALISNKLNNTNYKDETFCSLYSTTLKVSEYNNDNVMTLFACFAAWPSCIRNNIKNFSIPSNSSSSVMEPLLTYINDPRPPMILSPAYHSSSVGPQVDTDRWRRFSPCQTHSNPFACSFLLLLASTFRNRMYNLMTKIIHLTW